MVVAVRSITPEGEEVVDLDAALGDDPVVGDHNSNL